MTLKSKMMRTIRLNDLNSHLNFYKKYLDLSISESSILKQSTFFVLSTLTRQFCSYNQFTRFVTKFSTKYFSNTMRRQIILRQRINQIFAYSSFHTHHLQTLFLSFSFNSLSFSRNREKEKKNCQSLTLSIVV